MTKACTTHHHACACRESHFRRLQQDNSWAEERLSDMAIELAELRAHSELLREAGNAYIFAVSRRNSHAYPTPDERMEMAIAIDTTQAALFALLKQGGER